MSSLPVLKNAGLVTAPNVIEAAQQGALAKADNCVIRSRDIIEPRRGQGQLAYNFGSSSTDRAKALFFFDDTLIIHYGSAGLNRLSRDTGAAFSDYSGTILPPDENLLRMQAALAGQSLFFTTSTGIKKLETPSSAVISAGAPKALSLKPTALPLAGAWLPNGESVAYRYTLVKTDANGLEIESTPSGPVVMKNTSGGAAYGQVTLNTPHETDATWTVRLYRTKKTTGADPGDECFLCYEGPNNGSGIADQMPEELLGDPLYTNENTGDGALSGNEPPPLGHDIAELNGRLFLANTRSRHRLFLTIVGVGAPNGVQVGNVITIGGQAFTAHATNESEINFLVVTSGTPSQNIEATAINLVRAINDVNNVGLDLYAYYISAADESPGRILIERRSPGSLSFSVTASANGSAWQPQLPTSGSTVASTDDAAPHRLCYSKLQQPDAWPLLNRLEIGAKNSQILRILPLRDKLIVAKEDGWYAVSGTPPFRVDPLDNTAPIVGPDTAVVLGQQIYALTRQGVAVISDTGVGLIGLPIEVDVTSLFGSALSTTKLQSFGVGYESERLYILAVPTKSSDTTATQAYCWNALTRTWTRWPISRTCGRVNPANDTLYLGSGTANEILKERKTFTSADYADRTIAVGIIDYSGLNVALTVSTGVEVGDVLEDAAGRRAVITAVAANVVTVNATQAWAGTATVYKAIACEVQFQPITGGAPGLLKQFREVQFHWKELSLYEGKLGFSTELSQALVQSTFSNRGFGQRPWGEHPFGLPGRPKNTRLSIPAEKQRASYLDLNVQIREAFSEWKLQGFTLEWEPVSEKGVR